MLLDVFVNEYQGRVISAKRISKLGIAGRWTPFVNNARWHELMTEDSLAFLSSRFRLAALSPQSATACTADV